MCVGEWGGKTEQIINYHIQIEGIVVAFGGGGEGGLQKPLIYTECCWFCITPITKKLLLPPTNMQRLQIDAFLCNKITFLVK